jgi:protein-tyrosine-phosphatase
MSRRLRILAVCTYNRTRSVMMSPLLQQHAERAGAGVVVRSAGFSGGGGEPPTDNAVRLLRQRDIDASDHVSHVVEKQGVTDADLIITAEHQHVVAIAGRWPDAYGRTFTLPEIVELGERIGPRGERTHHEWLAALHAERPDPLDYLDHAVGEIADPTGKSSARWTTCFEQIDDLSERLIALLA